MKLNKKNHYERFYLKKFKELNSEVQTLKKVLGENFHKNIIANTKANKALNNGEKYEK